MRFGFRIAAAILLLLSASCSKDSDKDPGGDPDGGPLVGTDVSPDAFGLYDANNACFECFNAKCPDESKACSYACDVVGCLNECHGPDGGALATCASSCVADAGDTSDAASETAKILTCLKANCASECGL